MASTTTPKSVREQQPALFRFTHVDRRTCQRVVPMQVLSLGFSRTGTSSMQLALEMLGYPTYHMTSMVRNIPDADMWIEAHNTKYFHKPGPSLDRTFWDKLLGHVSATTDLPCAVFFEELIAVYPGVKCVLVEREVEAWYKSWYDIGKLWTVVTDCIMKGSIGGSNKQELIDKSRDVYREHNKAVREKVPREQLLVYELGSGWEPLCAFLGKPVPDVPFPRVNETEMVNEYVQELLWMGLVSTLKRWTVRILPVAASVGLGLMIWRYQHS
ncbi:hypothetical protein LTR97_007219 [Elasticomyces elasticus]|uniref:P-loop containing nucleoside triphosphate hydrolase protein n=1 Tax=Elasticomyces elasticus TaxID=574655 RepID=A0AAN7W4D4_9PEZI|nr:hypothetical protein LTR97_007219 [Elasticomyces elasticus]